MSSAPDFSDRVGSAFARAKLNLSLRVLARETSGYHQIETQFCLIELADEIEITLRRDGDIVLDVHAPPEDRLPPPDLGPVAANLAYRAALAFQQETGKAAGAHIRLVKRIPIGAGLGGGSSDAATVLDLLNELHDTPLSRAQLVRLAGELGSDVPFFATRAAYALAWGRGGRVAPLAPLPAAPVLLALPPCAVSTADAYTALAMQRADGYQAPAAILTTPSTWRDIAASAANDFESVIFYEQPLLASLHRALQQHGPVMARMTGTGSTVFAVFDNVVALRAARAKLTELFTATRFLETRTVTL